MSNAWNPVPATIRINRMLGATRPIRPPAAIRPMSITPGRMGGIGGGSGGMKMPHLGGGSSTMHMLMRPLGRAYGGGILDSPHAPFDGGIMSANAGRADDIQMHVPNGSYVMPAWFVSHLGQGNSMNGMTVLKMMFGEPWQGAGQAAKTPYGAPVSKMGTQHGMGPPKPPPINWQPPNLTPGMSAQNPALAAHGGAARDGGGPVPINASGGEFVITPEMVAHVGQGDISKGHKILDRWVIEEKKNAVKTLQKLPGPAQS